MIQPADLSPIPEAEAPRDCPLCPRLVRYRKECRDEHPDWWNAPVPAFGDPSAWLAIAGLAPGKHGANRPVGPSPAISRVTCSTQRYSSSGSPRASIAPTGDGLQLKGAIILNAVKCLPPANKPEPREIATCRHYFEEGAGRAPEPPGARRAGPNRARRSGAGAWLATIFDQVRPWSGGAGPGRPHPAVELSLLALQPEHADGSMPRCSKACSSGRYSYGRIMITTYLAAALLAGAATTANANCTAIGPHPTAVLKYICDFEAGWAESVASGDPSAVKRSRRRFHRIPSERPSLSQGRDGGRYAEGTRNVRVEPRQ